MPDDQSGPVRRKFLKIAALGGTVGLGLWLSQTTPILKSIAGALRTVPGFGYSGTATQLRERIDADVLLTAAEDCPGYWVGAPALEYSMISNRLLVHVRYRNPQERGHTVSIHELDSETLELRKLLSVTKEELSAKSLEGGAIIESDGDLRWILSYQSETAGDWRLQKREASSVEGLSTGGEDLELDSEYFHTKDPSFVNGNLYAVSYSRNWLDSEIQRLDLVGSSPVCKPVELTGVANGRISGGGVAQNEIFVDIWPDFPGTGSSNVLWTADERSTTGTLEAGTAAVDSSQFFVSHCSRSLKYLSAVELQGTVFVLWQGENCDGSNDLFGTKVSLDQYREALINY